MIAVVEEYLPFALRVRRFTAAIGKQQPPDCHRPLGP